MIKTEILIVDDEPQIQRLLEVGLKGYGYEVTVAINGQQAIMSAAHQEPDIIVRDVDLGSHPDGLEVCSEIRKWTSTPIIICTVNNDKRTRPSMPERMITSLNLSVWKNLRRVSGRLCDAAGETIPYWKW